MKTLIGTLAIVCISSIAYADDITGTWRYIDDKTGEAKGLVKIEKQSNGTFSGTALKSTPRPGYTPKEFCTNCPAPYTNKPILGLDVLTGLQHDKDLDYKGGKIIDPLSGKIYSMKAKLSPNGKRLQLRGYVGVSALGRTQIWIRQE